MNVRDEVVEYLRGFDAGIAPTANDVVNSLVDRHTPDGIRSALAELHREGTIDSRWDCDARVYWCD